MRPRLLLALLLGCVAAGAVLRADVRPDAGIDPQVFRSNLERWLGLGEAERAALRERWRQVSVLPSGEREALLQRADTLRRLRAALQQRTGHEPSAEEAAGELARTVEQARRHIQREGAPPVSDAELLAALEARTRRHIVAFLENLQRRQRLEPGRAEQLLAQPFAEQVRDSLLLLKSEQINLYAEGRRPAEADELLALSPLDVADRAERRRREEGFLGRLGQALPLSDEERRAVARDAEGWVELLERLRDRKAPEIRDLLAARGVPSESIEALLVGPVSEMEREGNRLLVALPGPAAAPGDGLAAPQAAPDPPGDGGADAQR